ncbi:hypothetical protein JHW43_008494 [Diplocarpon mali]|nr:hypothetical protein JHW43_008494 [Diplocarpon mali]
MLRLVPSQVRSGPARRYRESDVNRSAVAEASGGTLAPHSQGDGNSSARTTWTLVRRMWCSCPARPGGTWSGSVGERRHADQIYPRGAAVDAGQRLCAALLGGLVSTHPRRRDHGVEQRESRAWLDIHIGCVQKGEEGMKLGSALERRRGTGLSGRQALSENARLLRSESPSALGYVASRLLQARREIRSRSFALGSLILGPALLAKRSNLSSEVPPPGESAAATCPSPTRATAAGRAKPHPHPHPHPPPPRSLSSAGGSGYSAAARPSSRLCPRRSLHIRRRPRPGVGSAAEPPVEEEEQTASGGRPSIDTPSFPARENRRGLAPAGDATLRAKGVLVNRRERDSGKPAPSVVFSRSVGWHNPARRHRPQSTRANTSLTDAHHLLETGLSGVRDRAIHHDGVEIKETTRGTSDEKAERGDKVGEEGDAKLKRRRGGTSE